MRYLGLLILATALPCFSQGTVNFANLASGVDAPATIYSVTPPIRASGAFQAQLYVGPVDASHFVLTTNGISGTPATFLSGAGAGYFFGGTRTIEGIAPGTIVTLQVRAWATLAGTSWEAASPLVRGESNLIHVTLGDSLSVPNMVGLNSFSATMVPEPSSLALAVLGALAVGFFGMRRRVGRD